MASELQRRAQLLQASLDPSTNKQAELELRAEEQKPNFAVSLLHIVADQNFSSSTRLASALCFKNFLKREWTDGEGNHKLPPAEVDTIKQEIIGLMISVPSNLQAQLGDAVGIIADSDFHLRWDTLVQDLESRFSGDNFTTNIGVLQVAHSIFKRWRPLFRSDDLYMEINHVIEHFVGPFLRLVAATNQAIETGAADKERSVQLMNTMTLIMKLIYDLSCQDLPPPFETNISVLGGLFERYLAVDQAALHTDTDEESGPLEFLKSSVLEVLTLYVQKYDDAISGLVPSFVQRSWSLLTTVGREPKFDILVSKALQFLTTVIRIPGHSGIFADESALRQVVELVIIPNLALRDSDIELFEDDPIEFIRRDIEGSDNDTRRRAATDFLRSLLEQHEQTTSRIVKGFIEQFLEEYTRDPTANWRSKDTAIYLFCSAAAKGSVTSREGVKTVSERLEVIPFFQNNVANDLTSQDAVHPVLKVDAIKYLYVFRSQLNRDQWATAFPLLVQHLASPQYVVYTYAAIAVERALALSDDANNPVIDRDAVVPHAKDLLEHLFKLIQKDVGADRAQSATKVQENEFLMRCVMRVLIVMRESLVPLIEMILQHLMAITTTVSSNPSNPRFCYYLFEALGAVVKFAAPTHPQQLEAALFPPLYQILEADVQDFIPYVIQLLAAMLEANPSASMPERFKQLLPLIVRVDLWLSKGNVPALVRLLSSMIRRAAPDFESNGHVEPVLGIFERLLSFRALEVQACELLECILFHFSRQSMANYYVPVMTLVLTKLDKKTETFQTRFVKLYHFISASVDEGLGADFFMQLVDKIGAERNTQNLYVQLYLTIILPGTPKLTRPLDRKVAIISCTRTLTKSKAFAEKYAKGWGYTCDRLLELLINPPVIGQTDDIIMENDVDDSAFGVGFTPLVTIRKAGHDTWPNISNVKDFVSSELKAADAREKGQITRFVQERLSPESRQALLAYMQG